MKTTINFCNFQDAFNSIRPDNFSYEGLQALFTYLEDLEDDTGEEIDLDVIAICCNYSEYENIAEFNSNYNKEYESYEEIDETSVIPINDERFIIQDY